MVENNIPQDIMTCNHIQSTTKQLHILPVLSHTTTYHGTLLHIMTYNDMEQHIEQAHCY